MEDFVSLETIKELYSQSDYINFSTLREDGHPHMASARVSHGHSLSLYFLSEVFLTKSQNVIRDPRISGNLMIERPRPGTGFNMFFDGVAQVIAKDGSTSSLLPVRANERENKIRALCAGRGDYAENVEHILAEKGDLRLHRITLTQAWYNGGIYNNDSPFEDTATKNLEIVGDKACPLVRRYFVDADKPTPDYAIALPPTVIRAALGFAA